MICMLSLLSTCKSACELSKICTEQQSITNSGLDHPYVSFPQWLPASPLSLLHQIVAPGSRNYNFCPLMSFFSLPILSADGSSSIWHWACFHIETLLPARVKSCSVNEVKGLIVSMPERQPGEQCRALHVNVLSPQLRWRGGDRT